MMENDNLPIYQRIVRDLTARIEDGTYAPGDRIPSDNQLAESYDTSVPTVRKALSDMVYHGRIYRIKGKGTYVTTPRDLQKPASTKSGNVREKLICFLMLLDRSDDAIIKMITGAQRYLFSQNCIMSILCGTELAKTEQQLVQNCLDNNVDGVIWFSNSPEDNVEGLRLLDKHGIPVVMLDRGPTQMPFTFVSCYNLDGGYQMAKYLLSLGHRKIVFATDEMRLPAERERYRGHCMALAEQGLTADKDLLVKSCCQNMDALVARIRKEKITAIQCVHDKMAAQLVRRLLNEGFRIPEDISVTGFDDAAESEYCHPRITSVFQPFEAMGAEAARLVLEKLSGGRGHSQIYLPVRLVVKESTGPASAG